MTGKVAMTRLAAASKRPSPGEKQMRERQKTSDLLWVLNSRSFVIRTIKYDTLNCLKPVLSQ